MFVASGLLKWQNYCFKIIVVLTWIVDLKCMLVVQKENYVLAYAGGIFKGCSVCKKKIDAFKMYLREKICEWMNLC